MPAANTVDNGLDLTNFTKSSQMKFIINFNEDGSPIHCHTFIRLPRLTNQPMTIEFSLPEAFTPEILDISVEIQKDSELFTRSKIEDEKAQVEFNQSGTFRFFLKSGNVCYPSGFIQIPPSYVDQDDIKLVTLVSKWMGPLDSWESYFRIIKDLGYNMIHFTPLQQRGVSNSPYSIKNQLKLSDDIFKSEKDLEMVLKKMNSECELFGMIDIVWNHTACDSEWLIDHPEAGYNLENSPHLKVAFELDESILSFSDNLAFYGHSGHLNTENDLLEMIKSFKDRHLVKSRLWEYFVIDVSAAERQLEEYINTPDHKSISALLTSKVRSIEEAEYNDGLWERFSIKVNVDTIAAFYSRQIEEIRSSDQSKKTVLLSSLLAQYRRDLDELNLEKYKCYDEVIKIACENIYNRALYERIADNGPKIGPVSQSLPLVPTYFTRVPKRGSSQNEFHALANNGWVWNADPFKNFAESSSQAYLKREVIVWGDCVKLRYGSRPEDNPWLWNHMIEYTNQMAKHFHAFRIDNCHSTPIHVASHLLMEARKVRPDLYVCAELFTGSEEKDMKFVTELGINSLIRESMVAWDSNEIVRLALNYGGFPIGSFQALPEDLKDSDNIKASVVASVKSRPHNIFFDCTHDNEPPAQKRTPADTLSNSAIVALTRCATGSTFGYDQLIPHHVNVVEETRKYDLNVFSCPFANVKKWLNDFHGRLVTEGCTEVFARCYENGVILISVDNPTTHSGYTLITRTAYSWQAGENSYNPIDFPGSDIEVVCSAEMKGFETDFRKNPKVINGLKVEISFMEGGCPSDWFSSNHNSSGSTLELKHLPQGSFVVLKRRLIEEAAQNIKFLQSDLNLEMLQGIVEKLNLIDMNYVMYRCDDEERDEFPGIGGVYNVPSYGNLSYCGIEGANIMLSIIKRHNIVDHALCKNLREGSWLLDYTLSRLERSKNININAIREWALPVFEHLKSVPGYLRPKYTIKVFEKMSKALKEKSFKLMDSRLINCGDFAKKLALGSVQMVGVVPSTGLHPTRIQATLCAGLPHFTTHHMRCWGRDIFIAFRGLLLFPGRFDVAREHLKAFAGCVYRGLIPNLLDSARRPRYNARDATWWFLQALQDYCKYSPDGYEILEERIPLRFPGACEYVDFDDERIFAEDMTVKEIIQMIMQSHAEGIHFREWNAGPQLDSVMRSEGFQVDIEVDWRTGFIHGGNRWNCGTWMDKMGESELAGNRGIPTTARDGAAIEITALLKSTLDWLSLLKSAGFSGVKKSDGEFISYELWSELIQEAFEPEYFIKSKVNAELEAEVDDAGCYYRDVVGGSSPVASSQMRPNYLLAMAISPGLFKVSHARQALATAEKNLTGPFGMKTLSPLDPAYRPNYNNSLDCADGSVAKGANYHQGPEWLWCMGYYLRAWLTFNLSTADTENTRKLVLKRLQPHRHLLRNSPAAGLPELTNENGAVCGDSCWSQAWSMACLLEVVLQVKQQ